MEEERGGQDKGCAAEGPEAAGRTASDIQSDIGHWE